MSEITESFGKWITERRKSKKLSLHEVSVGAGIKVSDLKKIEIGKNMVPFSQLTKLEKFLEFKISDFTKTLPKEKE